MKNDELDLLLRELAVPERDEAYWKEFQDSLLHRIRSDKQPAATRVREGTSTLSKWTFSLGFGCTAMLVALFVATWTRHEGRADEQIEALRRCYRQVADLFPWQFEAVILSDDDVQLQLSDTPAVNDSPPLFVRICPPSSRCATAVSFSGRKIRVSGRVFEILANGDGEIFLMVGEGVWWKAGRAPTGCEGWRFESGWLEQSL